MSQSVTRTVSTLSGLWLDSMRKSFAALRRAIPKDVDPSVKVEAVNSYCVQLTAEWNEYV